MSGAHVRPFGPQVALGIASLGLAGCGIAMAFASRERLDDPFTLALCICAAIASFALVDLEGTLFWGGSLVPYVCAFSVLGPGPAVLVGVIGELSVWLVDRYRISVFPLNLLSVVAPNLLAAETLQATGLSPDGVLFYVAVLAVAAGAVALNLAMITVLAGLYHHQPIVLRLRSHLKLAPAIAINILVAIAAIAVYFKVGLGAAVFALAGVVVFTYLARQVAKEREHLGRISRLAEERGALVARILETEDRERRALADVLHDDIIQLMLAARQDIEEAIDGDDDALARARSALRDAVANSRRTLVESHPSILQRVGLAAAITTTAEHHAQRSGARIKVAVDPAATGVHDRLLFSIARELLNNVAKHASARMASVRVSRHGEQTRLTVADDGIGIAEAQREAALRAGHVGLASVEERVHTIGGTFEIGPGINGHGTTIHVTLPRVASRGQSATSQVDTPRPEMSREVF